MYQAECKSYIDNFLTYNMMTIISIKKKKKPQQKILNWKFFKKWSLQKKELSKVQKSQERFKDKQFAKFWMVFVFIL